MSFVYIIPWQNPSDTKKCSRCGKPLDVETAVKTDEENQHNLRKIVYEMINEKLKTKMDPTNSVKTVNKC
ncbi:MAG: hypothetical protein OEL69_02585 [Nitrosopumilus sp.]|nr:hypothetical protein [Nitrosopumilus sp.]